MQLLKEKLENEKYERRIAEQAQFERMAEMAKELKEEKKREVERMEMLARK